MHSTDLWTVEPSLVLHHGVAVVAEQVLHDVALRVLAQGGDQYRPGGTWPVASIRAVTPSGGEHCGVLHAGQGRVGQVPLGGPGQQHHPPDLGNNLNLLSRLDSVK